MLATNGDEDSGRLTQSLSILQRRIDENGSASSLLQACQDEFESWLIFPFAPGADDENDGSETYPLPG
jgi:hypothetical protein